MCILFIPLLKIRKRAPQAHFRNYYIFVQRGACVFGCALFGQAKYARLLACAYPIRRSVSLVGDNCFVCFPRELGVFVLCRRCVFKCALRKLWRVRCLTQSFHSRSHSFASIHFHVVQNKRRGLFGSAIGSLPCR